MKYYPVTITQARYGGTYEGGAWLAFYVDPEMFAKRIDCDEAFGSDIECMDWWRENGREVGKGSTPDNALLNLCEILDAKFGAQLWQETETSWCAYHKFRKNDKRPWIVVERDGEQRTVTINYAQSQKKIVGWDGEWEITEGGPDSVEFFLRCVSGTHLTERKPLEEERTQEI